jgi:hypothetical protein
MFWNSKDGPRPKCGRQALKVLRSALSRRLSHSRAERNKQRALPDSWVKQVPARRCRRRDKLDSWVYPQSSWHKGVRRKAPNWACLQSSFDQLMLRRRLKQASALSSYQLKRA